MLVFEMFARDRQRRKPPTNHLRSLIYPDTTILWRNPRAKRLQLDSWRGHRETEYVACPRCSKDPAESGDCYCENHLEHWIPRRCEVERSRRTQLLARIEALYKHPRKGSPEQKLNACVQKTCRNVRLPWRIVSQHWHRWLRGDCFTHVIERRSWKWMYI